MISLAKARLLQSKYQTGVMSKACYGNSFETRFTSVSVVVTRETCKSTAKSMICFKALLTV
jgi:hypothetical protein